MSINQEVIILLSRYVKLFVKQNHLIVGKVQVQKSYGTTMLAILRECSPPTMCPMSRVTRHMSHVTCHVSHIMCHMS